MLPSRYDFQIYQGDTIVKPFTFYSQSRAVYKGEWSSVVNYKVNDFVENSSGDHYICTAAHRNHEPPNVSYWTTLTPTDLSSSTILAKIKVDVDDTNFFLTITPSFVTDGTDGKIKLTISSANSATIVYDEVYYDVQITTGTTVTTYLTGKIKVRKQIT